MLTICYLTHRRYNCVQWWIDSLANEMRADGSDDVRVVVVDYYQPERIGSLPSDIIHVTPKPSAWQGPHRLTTRDYFAASNARNTGLCLAPDGWIAYCDDLSVLLPGWLACVRQAMREGYIALGAYRKVLGLDVEGGKIVSFLNHAAGRDSRWNYGSDHEAVPQGPGALFGCSLAGPVETFLAVNGWNEALCDGMGYEDCAMGLQLKRHTSDLVDMRYDRRMMTYESEEMHYVEQAFVRVDKKMTGPHPDASHAMIARIQASNGVATNPFDLRDVRRRVLAGEPFPITQVPEHHWPDGQPLREM